MVIAVEGNVQHPRVLIEDVLDPISMVYIPVQDKHSVDETMQGSGGVWDTHFTMKKISTGASLSTGKI